MKHRIDSLKQVSSMITGSPSSDFHFAYANMHGNVNIWFKNAKNGQEMVKFNDGKDFNNLFAKSFRIILPFCEKLIYVLILTFDKN